MLKYFNSYLGFMELKSYFECCFQLGRFYFFKKIKGKRGEKFKENRKIM